MAQVVSVVPTVNRSAVVLNGEALTIPNTEEVVAYFEGLSPGDTVLALMGGPGQNLFVRAQQMGLDVRRIPWFDLERLVPGIVGASGEERARALKTAWDKPARDEFYPLLEVDQTILMLRELTRIRLNIQNYRKPAQLQYMAAWRDLAPLFPTELMEQAEQAALAGSSSKSKTVDYSSRQFKEFMDSLPREQRDAVELRVMFADPEMISGALADEARLEKRIKKLAGSLDIWSWLHPGKDDVLPEVLGLGPSLGGSLIGEILDIKRFPTPLHLRSYARYGLDSEGRYPRRRKGEVASWNRYLDRAVWLWTTDQMPRYKHVWRALYDHYKWRELRAHPGPLATDNGTKFTLGHLDKRAKRKTGSALLNYVWGLWTAGANGQDLEHWFRTSAHNNWPVDDPLPHMTWDQFFNGIILPNADRTAELVKAEVVRRRAKGEDAAED